MYKALGPQQGRVNASVPLVPYPDAKNSPPPSLPSSGPAALQQEEHSPRCIEGRHESKGLKNSFFVPKNVARKKHLKFSVAISLAHPDWFPEE